MSSAIDMVRFTRLTVASFPISKIVMPFTLRASDVAAAFLMSDAVAVWSPAYIDPETVFSPFMAIGSCALTSAGSKEKPARVTFLTVADSIASFIELKSVATTDVSVLSLLPPG